MHTLLLLLSLFAVPSLEWGTFHSSMTAQGITFSDPIKALDGQRVRLRGYAVTYPRLDGGLFLTRFEHEDPHGVEEHDLPFDAVGVVWRKGIALPPVPRRPTVEGTLRLGNRRFGEEFVSMTLEDAVPVIPTKK
ncbi:MAG: hypothetical protein JOZ54_03225 [Acidobacteria bacterium]|nr:hypothetical protein [Acidobacteriota bacterium]